MPRRYTKPVEQTANTIKNKQSTFNRLQKVFDVDEKGMDKLLVKSPKKVIDKLKELYPNENTRKTYFSRIVAYMKTNNIGPNVVKKYSTSMNEAKEKVQEVIDENELTANQAEKHVTWDQILDVREQAKKLSELSFDQYQDYLILCLYTMLPPVRTDFAVMEVINRMPAKTKLNDEDTTNYYVKSANKQEFVINRYKTKKAYGTNSYRCPDDLAKVIDLWLKEYNTKPSGKSPHWLLVNETATAPLSPVDLVQRIRNIFNKFTGLKVGINLLRHAFLSNMLQGCASVTLKERKKWAGIMGHSVATQIEYVKLTPKKKEIQPEAKVEKELEEGGKAPGVAGGIKDSL
jgi:hypothetical protein